MRKIFICFFISFFLSQWLCASGFFGSIYGGAASAKMGGYNTGIQNTNKYNEALGAGPSLKRLELSMVPEISAGYVFDTPAGGAGIYVKNSIILLYDEGSAVLWPDKKMAHYIRSDLSVFYSAIGVRLGVTSGVFPGITGYVAAEGGICHYYSSFMEEETFKEDGGVIHKIRKEWKPSIPSAAVEAGVEWKFSGNLGLGIKGGYRLAAGTVPVKINNIEGWTGPLSGEDALDYSGFYGGIGLLISFENAPEKANPMKDSSFPGIAGILYKDAESFYSEGLYRQAWQKISEAKNAAPQNNMILELSLKIEEGLKTENSAEKIQRLMKEGDDLRAKGGYKQAAKRYGEVLKSDPGNSHARFYIEEMEKEGEISYQAAAAFVKERNLTKALEKAKTAADYGHKRAESLEKEIKEMINKKKENNRLFNIGVEHYRKGDYKNAASSWEAVLKSDPSDTETAENLKKAWKKIDENSDQEAKSEALAVKEAVECFKLGDFNCASGKCSYALSLNPGNKECTAMLLEVKAAELKTETEIFNTR